MKRYALPPAHVNFIILVPLLVKTMGSGEKAMTG